MRRIFIMLIGALVFVTLSTNCNEKDKKVVDEVASTDLKDMSIGEVLQDVSKDGEVANITCVDGCSDVNWEEVSETVTATDTAKEDFIFTKEVVLEVIEQKEVFMDLSQPDVCVPLCDGLDCGDDGCGAQCGECFGNETCVDGKCVCVPQCDDKVCGDDLCEGSCGDCEADYSCEDGKCVCVPQCDAQECGLDPLCGKSCGLCNQWDNSFCGEDYLCYCESSCEEKECGTDGCSLDFNCGTCLDVSEYHMCDLETNKCILAD